MQPRGLSNVQGDSQSSQFSSCWPLSGSATTWHIFWQKWFPQFNFRLHFLPHERILACEHSNIEVSWRPKQTTGIFVLHWGCGIFFISMVSGCTSPGNLGTKLLSLVTTMTLSWQPSKQGWPHFKISLHICRHLAQSPKWQKCGCWSWWHFDGHLHNSLHFGDLLFFARPHKTLTSVDPQRHLIVCFTLHG